MQLTIDIPDHIYNTLVETGKYLPYSFDAKKAIKNGTPLAKVFGDIKAEISEEKDCAYEDFEHYKVAYLGVDAEYVEDELPNDDYRYGMERALEIINNHIADNDERIPKGHWEEDRCTICGKGIEDLIDSREWYRNKSPNFCPFCGERMAEDENRRQS